MSAFVQPCYRLVFKDKQGVNSEQSGAFQRLLLHPDNSLMEFQCFIFLCSQSLVHRLIYKKTTGVI